MAKAPMDTLQLSCIHIAITLLLFTRAKSTTEETSAHPNGTITSCIAGEISSLLAFRAGLSDPANLLSSWKGDDCCRWKGIYCDSRTGHVVRLDLRGPDYGTGDENMQVLAGNISSTLLGLQHLQYLDLSSNRFDKIQIPEFLGSLHKLRYLDLSLSKFIGRIPPQLGNLSSLRYLNLATEYLSRDYYLTYSTDITWLSRLTSLEHLDMTLVNLSTVGHWLPVMNMLPTLKVLCVRFCNLSSCPDSLQLSNLTSLETLDLWGNNFHKRSTHNWFWDLASLKYLDISENGFYGPFPDEIAWIGEKLSSLSFLRLRSNMFYGHIPSELTKLVDLQYLDLANNNISGIIPRSILNYKSMRETRDNSHNLRYAFTYTFSLNGDGFVDYTANWTVLTKGQERLYTGEIIYMVNFDLSCNSLTGEIPPEISGLVELKSLNLSWNNFSGRIPENVGALMQVESLDLSHNDLSSQIPSSLSDLTSLSRLNLSYNNLSGRIPSGNQLQTLEDPASIYIGNPGLCGPPLSWKCSSQPEPIPGGNHGDPNENDVVSLFLATGSGYVMGLWVVFCTLLFNRKWRASWYLLYDRIYVQVAVAWASLRGKMG
ncbi:unnamed protein product [Alopecurus aequalis]